MSNLNEGLIHGDLRGMVSDVIVVDKHVPKIGHVEDTVVVAMRVLYQEPASDLAKFIESSPVEHLDVEVGDSPTRDGQWLVFIEFLRDHNLFEKISALLTSIEQVTSEKGTWKFRPFEGNGKLDWNRENFKANIIDSRSKYVRDVLQETLVETWTRKLRKYQKHNA